MSSSQPTPNSRAVASIMARGILFVVFLGSGLWLVLTLFQSSLATPVCLGAGVIALAMLLIGSYYVARARAE